MHRGLGTERGRQLFHQEAPAFRHAQRRLDEDTHRLFQRRLEIVEKIGDVLEPADGRGGFLGGRAIG